MNFAQITEQFDHGARAHDIAIPANWLQGRTAFGGLSAALGYHAASIIEDALPPLKSAQIAFSGPLSDRVQIHSKMLRRGRNSAFVRVEVSSDGETGLACVFAFMADRDSKYAHRDMDRSDLPPLPDETDLRSGPPEFFTSNFEYAHSRGTMQTGEPQVGAWYRLKERDGIDPVAELLLLGDALPPASFGLMDGHTNFSSLAWQANMVSNAPQTRGGWWYVHSDTGYIANGNSSEYMCLYNSDGMAVLNGTQSVAIFS